MGLDSCGPVCKRPLSASVYEVDVREKISIIRILVGIYLFLLAGMIRLVGLRTVFLCLRTIRTSLSSCEPDSFSGSRYLDYMTLQPQQAVSATAAGAGAAAVVAAGSRRGAAGAAAATGAGAGKAVHRMVFLPH